MCPNLILDDHIGLLFSKNTKTSPLSIILLMLGLAESPMSVTKNFQGKKVRNSVFGSFLDEEKRRTWSCHSLDQSYKIKLSNSYNSMANTAKMDSGDISSNNKS